LARVAELLLLRFGLLLLLFQVDVVAVVVVSRDFSFSVELMTTGRLFVGFLRVLKEFRIEGFR
jgi:hypothetical protein